MNISNKYIGRTGIDCWALLCLVYRTEFGIVLPYQFDMQNYTMTKGTKALEFAATTDLWVPLKQPTEKCVVAMSKNKRIHHVGIWLDGGCLHADEAVVHNNLAALIRNGYGKVEYYKWHTL